VWSLHHGPTWLATAAGVLVSNNWNHMNKAHAQKSNSYFSVNTWCFVLFCFDLTWSLLTRNNNNGSTSNGTEQITPLRLRLGVHAKVQHQRHRPK